MTIKISQRSVCLMIGAIFLMFGFAKCEVEELPKESYAAGSVETHVGPFERLVIMLTKPLSAADDIVKDIGKGFKNIWKHLPGVKNDTETGKESKRKSLPEILNPLKDKIRAIYPGTYWCGDGDIATNEEDLGLFKDTDACCRTHDSCKDGIPSKGEEHGLKNTGIFTRSACYCDQEFYRCLKEAQNLIATNIGTTYFNILRPQCFREDYPIENCKIYTGTRLIEDKCKEYNFNISAPKKVQWFDNPDFLG